MLLHGIVYLHRITNVPMHGSAKKNLLMLKKLCGDDALRKVVLTTTMWDKVPNREAEDREQQLVDTPEFWGFMVSKVAPCTDITIPPIHQYFDYIYIYFFNPLLNPKVFYSFIRLSFFL